MATGMWDAEDGFFYDVLHLQGGDHVPMKVRSMVGLIPLYAVETLDSEMIDRLPGFRRRLEWFLENRKDLTANVACMRSAGQGDRRLMSIVDGDQLRRVLHVMLDENEFLSPFGIRALSRVHKDNPYVLRFAGGESQVSYEPAESTHRIVWWELQLAWADLVPGKLPAHRVVAEVSPLLR